MYNAISTLMEMVEEPENLPRPDKKRTNEVIQQISSLITKMVDEEDEDESRAAAATAQPPPPPQTPPVGTPRRLRSNRSSVELPTYPTPYELWQKAHQRAPEITPLQYVDQIPKSERAERASGTLYFAVTADTAGQWHALVCCSGRHRRPVARSSLLLWSTPQASGTL